MHNFFKGFLVSLALLFLVGCHHNAHIRTQKPLSQSETVISSSMNPGPITSPKKNMTLGIIGRRLEFSFLRGLENDRELGAYVSIGIREQMGSQGNVLGLHYKKYKYLSPIERLVKIGGGLEINFSNSGAVFNSKASIISASSINNPIYFGIHFLHARSYGKIKGYSSPIYSNGNYSMQSRGIGMTIGKEREIFIQNTSFQSQFDVSIVHDGYNYIDDSFYSIYLLFSYSLGLNFFLPPSNPKKSFEPLPYIQKRETKSSSDIMSNTSTELFDPETGEPIKNKSATFDPETGEVID